MWRCWRRRNDRRDATSVILTTLLIAQAASAAPVSAAPVVTCIVDEDALLALAPEVFDQDFDGGWRAVYNRPECRGDAARIIALYRESSTRWQQIMAWHEGQIRATLGETEAAIDLMQMARRPDVENGSSNGQWNAYVDATVAFLNRDRAGVENARSRLIDAPPPAHWTGDRPMNLSVVDRFLTCFGRPYSEAYSSAACRPDE